MFPLFLGGGVIADGDEKKNKKGCKHFAQYVQNNKIMQ